MPSVSLVLPENIFSVSLVAREGFLMLRWYRSQEELSSVVTERLLGQDTMGERLHGFQRGHVGRIVNASELEP